MASSALNKSDAYRYFFDKALNVGREWATGRIPGAVSAQFAQAAPEFVNFTNSEL